jgi:hypothetical protein
MKAILKATCALSVVLTALNAAAAGDLVNGGVINKITVRNSASAPNELMKIETVGGGSCAEIVFQKTGNADLDNRLVSLATAAYLAGKKVRVYDYDTTTSCASADFVAMLPD